MKLKIFALASVTILIFVSCKKDKANNCDKTMAAISGTYSVIKMEVGLAGRYENVTDSLDACERDDKLTLNSDGTAVYKDAGVTCDSNGDSNGTWSVDNNGNVTIDSGSSEDVSSATIESFDCSNLVLKAEEYGLQFRLTLKK